MKYVLIFCLLCIVLPANCVTVPEYDEIVPQEAIYEYVEPVKRAKWVKPLAWVGYAGTLFLIPFPLYLNNTDNKIAANNGKYETYQKMKANFYKEIAECKRVFKKEKEIYKCYNDVKMQYAYFATNQQTQYNQANQLRIQKQQLQELRTNNSKSNYTYSTTTKSGDTYTTHSYSY